MRRTLLESAARRTVIITDSSATDVTGGRWATARESEIKIQIENSLVNIKKSRRISRVTLITFQIGNSDRLKQRLFF